MTQDRWLRRKWTFCAYGKKVVFIKSRSERTEHVLMKTFLWALYLPQYPMLRVETRIGDRYKPDVVALDDEGYPVFWGEAGQVGVQKIRSLLRRYPQTHFAMGKWHTNLNPHIEIVQNAREGSHHTAPFDFIRFANRCAERFIDDVDHIHINFEDVEWYRLE